MTHTDDAYTYMLLTLSLTPDGSAEAKPLSPEEMCALAAKLDVNSRAHISRLLNMDVSGFMKHLGVNEDFAYRLYVLLRRDALLSKLIDDCLEKSTEIVTPFDKDYPRSLITRLGAMAAPPLFVRGYLSILGADNVGIMGLSGLKTPKNIEEGIKKLIWEVAPGGFGLVTGGEPGASRFVRSEAFENDARISILLPGGLNAYCETEEIATALEEGCVCIASAAHPDSSENATEIAERNKLIFALSNAAFVATTDGKRGEIEAVRRHLCDYTYVFDAPELSGNAFIAARGFETVKSVSEMDMASLMSLWAGARCEQLSFL